MKGHSYNWLVHRIHDSYLEPRIHRYAKGILLDVGCGDKPYEIMTRGYAQSHIGLDHPQTQHSSDQIDIFGTAYEIGLSDSSVNTILCTVVLEHLERPQNAITEMYRILSPGGYLLLSAPQCWHLHEEPRDFFRYTKYGLDHLLKTSGFEVVEQIPLSGFIVTFGQEFCYLLNYFRSSVLKPLVTSIQWLVQTTALVLNRWDTSYSFTWAYLTVAKKPTQ